MFIGGIVADGDPPVTISIGAGILVECQASGVVGLSTQLLLPAAQRCTVGK
jgi:hypothetical protein